MPDVTQPTSEEVTCQHCGMLLTISTCFSVGPDGQPDCPAGGWHKERIDVYDPEAARRFLHIVRDSNA